MQGRAQRESARRRPGDRQGDRRARQAREPRRPLMAELKPAYLIHGDDHGAVAERRAGLRALAEGRRGRAASVEVLEGEAGTPAGGRRRAGRDDARDRTARDHRRRGRALAPGRGREAAGSGDGADAARHHARAVRARGGSRQGAGGRARGGQARGRAGRGADDASSRGSWPSGRASRPRALGLSLDAAAAKALVAQVGERQQRLLRELEKLALSPKGAAVRGRARASSAAAPGRSACRTSSAAPRTRPSGARTRWPTRSSAGDAARGDRSPICACASRASACRA